MRDAIRFTRLLRELGWRVDVTADGPRLRATTGGATLPPGVRRQASALRDELLKLNAPDCGTCGAAVFDGVMVAEANGCGRGAGCPLAACPYRE